MSNDQAARAIALRERIIAIMTDEEREEYSRDRLTQAHTQQSSGLPEYRSFATMWLDPELWG